LPQLPFFASQRQNRSLSHLNRPANFVTLTEAVGLQPTIDLVVAIILVTIYNAPVAMGPPHWIPALFIFAIQDPKGGLR
jgi:hypothetical protein